MPETESMLYTIAFPGFCQIIHPNGSFQHHSRGWLLTSPTSEWLTSLKITNLECENRFLVLVCTPRSISGEHLLQCGHWNSLFFKLLQSGGGAEGVVPSPAYPQNHLQIMFAENTGLGRSDHLSNGAVESDRLSSK